MTATGVPDGLFIDGRWVAPKAEARLPIVSPYTEQVIARAPGGNNDNMDAAVSAARDAFDRGPWSRTTVADRVEVVQRLGKLLSDRQEQIAQLITAEMGCPISQARAIQAVNPVRLIDAYVELADEYPFREVRRSRTGSALVTREPVGVVAAVVPWNVPMGISAQKLIPALIAGCTVVLKPAPQTALDGLLLAELCAEAGIPAGVVNVVPADREASEYLVSHPGVDKVGFTGSTAAGRRIAALCGNDLRRVTLELGGKSAAVVLDDADLDTTVESLRMGVFRNNGQICTLKTRVLVSPRRRAELVDRLAAMVASLVVGDPADAATEIGPVVSARQRETVEGYIASGREQGAIAVTGGGRPQEQSHGWFVEPTLFDGVDPAMTIAREEIFGPVVSVLTYRDDDEAVRIANDSPYGLHGAVFSSDLVHGLEIAGRLRTGAVELNGSPIGLRAPFGGFKSSGIGRENGVEGLDSYTEARSIGLPAGAEELAAASVRA